MIVLMDRAILVIPTFGTHWGYARPQEGETRFVLNIWIARIAGMIYFRLVSPLIRLVGTSRRSGG